MLAFGVQDLGERTYNNAASMIIASADAVRELLEVVRETISRTNKTTHIVDLMTFVMRKVRGFSLCRARRIISVTVRMRQTHNIVNHIGTTLLSRSQLNILRLVLRELHTGAQRGSERDRPLHRRFHSRQQRNSLIRLHSERDSQPRLRRVRS